MEALTEREYQAFQKLWYSDGFGQRAEFTRSANLIITIMNYITGAVGGKPKELTPEDVYQQLSLKPENRRPGNNAVDWGKTPSHLKKDLIELGLYDEDGNPTRHKNGDD